MVFYPIGRSKFLINFKFNNKFDQKMYFAIKMNFCSQFFYLIIYEKIKL